MMSRDLGNYGIFAQNELMTEASKRQQQKTVLLGQIVRIENRLEDGTVTVRCLKDNEQWDCLTFISCSASKIIPITEQIYPFLAAISSPQERVKLARNREKCDNLMSLTKDMTVAFTDFQDVYLGTLKYIGKVKGMGECFGIQLHEKRKKNNCNGSCAGIQYFTCLPGHGIFTTIDKVAPVHKPITKEKQKPMPLESKQDANIADIFRDDLYKNCEQFDCPKHEEIITKYGEYPKSVANSNSVNHHKNSNSTSLRPSLSLQNILEINNETVNTNNDFDQNSIIQPDRTYLVQENRAKPRSDVDLIDIIGNFTDLRPVDSYDEVVSNCNKESERNGKSYKTSTWIENGFSERAYKNKNILSQILESTSTLPRKIKPLGQNNDLKEKTRSTFYVNEKNTNKINERNDFSAHKPSSSGTVKSKYQDPPPGITNDITIGTLVEVSNDVSRDPLFGVVRWIGVERATGIVLVGVELEEENVHLPLTLTDGTYNNEKLFHCPDSRALFVPLEQCHKDSRFHDSLPVTVVQPIEKSIDKMDCPVIKGAVAPLCMPTEEDVVAVCGKYRGVQGHHNSCYLDVTLFSMFTYTCVFDSLLFRPRGPSDVADYDEVQRVLREEIVNPLRKNLFVSASNVMNLRKLLDRLSSVSGLTSEEKDPEEFLNSLLAQILKAEPFLKLNSGQEAFYYQLFVEKDAELTLPTVQQLFEQSFLTSNIKLKEVPACLIVQMPRFGKSYKMYPRILPSQLLDVTDVIEGSPRQCTVCGGLARWECRECFDDRNNVGLECTAFCDICLKTAHQHEKRKLHKPVSLEVTYDFAILAETCRPPRLYMELFAVICIETSHYVAFVKCGVGHEAPWCFFDSMADRKGEKHGYNIPEMVACPDISKWLSDEQLCRQLHEENPLDRHLPEHARRLLCDAYICMYQSSDVMMYR